MTLKNDRAYQDTNEQQFLDMCELAENVVKRRIEQLPEVAMADITGVPGKLLQIVPDKDKLAMTGITVEDIENALASNNVEPGSMLVGMVIMNIISYSYLAPYHGRCEEYIYP